MIIKQENMENETSELSTDSFDIRTKSSLNTIDNSKSSEISNLIIPDCNIEIKTVIQPIQETTNHLQLDDFHSSHAGKLNGLKVDLEEIKLSDEGVQSDCKNKAEPYNTENCLLNNIETSIENSNFSQNENIENNNEYQIHIINLKLNEIKNDHIELEDFIRLYFYVPDVTETRSTFEKNSMEIFFQTKSEAFNRLHNPQQFSNFAYKISLQFIHEVAKENSYDTVKKKSIEIHLQKLQKILWGSISLSITSHITAKNDLVVNFLPNKWTPCAQPAENTNKNEEEKNSAQNFKPLQNCLTLIEYNPSLENQLLTNENKRGKFYGFTGLDNLGNTCFMNSVLQCLANTDPLRDYFLSNQYVNDINKTNPLGTGGVIVRAFAQFLTQLWMGKQSSFSPVRIKTLSGEKLTAMFSGFNQHDAQEFMSYFLDSIHEDLNRNENKPKIDYSKDNDETEELFYESDFSDQQKRAQIDFLLKQKSEDMWKQYRLFNSSIIIDLFCGQFKSILTCPDCSKKSVTFDPFLYVPLPIPPSKATYEILFFFREKFSGMCQDSVRFLLTLSHRSTVGDLLNIVSKKTNISPKLMCLIQQQEGHLPPNILNPKWLLVDYYGGASNESQLIRKLFLFQIVKDENEEFTDICVIQRSISKLSLGNGLVNSKVGMPFIVSLKNSMLTYSYFCQVLCSYSSHSVCANRLVELSENDSCTNNRSISISHSSHTLQFSSNLFLYDKNRDTSDNGNRLPRLIYYKSTSVKDDELLAPFLLRKPNFNGSYVNAPEEEISPPIINEEFEDDCCSEDSCSTIVNSSNCTDDSDNDNGEQQVLATALPSNGQASEKCLTSINQNKIKHTENRFSPMSVAEFNNDALLDLSSTFYLAMDWIDSSENFPRVAVSLTSNFSRSNCINLSTNGEMDISLDDCFQLFNEPEVLGPQNCWRCPSCKELREATKQLSFWRLPPILVIQLKRFKMRNVIYRDKIKKFISYPIRNLDLTKYTNNCNGEQRKSIYDLYAVVNHSGDPFLGHFTAFARSFNGEFGWRDFDDSVVEKIENESSVVSATAYLLFYKLRTDAQ